MTRGALVVGGGSAVIAAIVEHLRGRGDVVGLVSTSTAGATSPDVVAVAVDLMDRVAVQDAINTVREQTGTFTTVVTVAQDDSSGAVGALAMAQWEDTWNAVATLNFTVAKHTLPDLTHSGGSFVAVTSTGAIRGILNHGAHAAATQGVVGLVKSMALDYARDGVRCNVVSAGFVPAHHDGRSFGVREVSDERIAARRAATADDIAHLVEHVTSARATFTTGAVITVDGGLTAGLLKDE